jgi:hypothetical protein
VRKNKVMSLFVGAVLLGSFALSQNVSAEDSGNSYDTYGEAGFYGEWPTISSGEETKNSSEEKEIPFTDEQGKTSQPENQMQTQAKPIPVTGDVTNFGLLKVAMVQFVIFASLLLGIFRYKKQQKF